VTPTQIGRPTSFTVSFVVASAGRLGNVDELSPRVTAVTSMSVVVELAAFCSKPSAILPI